MTDPGTSWLVGNHLYVGSNGALSRLVVSNGALCGFITRSGIARFIQLRMALGARDDRGQGRG